MKDAKGKKAEPSGNEYNYEFHHDSHNYQHAYMMAVR